MLIRLCFDTLAGAYVMSDDTSDDADELIVSVETSKKSSCALCNNCFLELRNRFLLNAQELTDLIADLEVHSFSACETSFLYRSRELLPACLSDIYSRPDEVRLRCSHSSRNRVLTFLNFNRRTGFHSWYRHLVPRSASCIGAEPPTTFTGRLKMSCFRTLKNASFARSAMTSRLIYAFTFIQLD